ncbi:MAG: DUF4173 domain-containing protein [Clostridia bacterium]|nr:DUF4173 domain-containing protein [Clostridia bacterium]
MDLSQPYPEMPGHTPGKKEKTDLYKMEKADYRICIGLAVLTVFGVIAGIWGGFRLGFTLAYGLFLLAVSLYLGRKGQKPGVFGAGCGVLALLMAPVFITTSNTVIRCFCVIGGAVLSAVWFASLCGRRPDTEDFGLIRLLFTVFFDSTKNMPRSAASVFSGGTRAKSVSKILLGVLCAVPVLSVVIPLLIRSDAAFEGMVSALFSNIATLAAQLLISAALIPFVTAFALSLKKETPARQAVRTGKGLDTAFLTTFTSVLCAAYICYLCSQLAYFFDAFRGFLPEGYENAYADYARRGFFELCAVAGINLAVMLFAVFCSRKKEGKPPVALRIPSTFIGLFTLVLIGTALAKMRLYISTFGLTVLRLGTSAFMVFLAVVFIALLMRIYLKRIRVFQTAVIAAALTVLILGLGNINGFVAKYNYEAYISGQLREIDTYYLRSLGPEGVPYILRLCEDETVPVGIRREAAQNAYYLYTDLYESEFDYLEPDGENMSVIYVFGDPFTRIYAKPSHFSLPLRIAYADTQAFLARHPDFPEKQGLLLAKDSARCYFEPEEPTTAAPQTND